MSILDDVTQWSAPDGTRPPTPWNGTAWQFAALALYVDALDFPAADELQINYAGQPTLPSSLTFNFAYPVALEGAYLILLYSIDGAAVVAAQFADDSASDASVEVEIPEGSSTFAWQVVGQEPIGEGAPAPPFSSGTVNVTGDGEDPPEISFNCECDEESFERTLLDMRTSLLRRLGFSAQAANPPAGVPELLDDFLRDAQEQLYMRYACLRTERFFRWQTQPGVRYYAVRSNNDLCDKKLNPYRISWAGVQDLNGSWSTLTCGIHPSFYTSVDFRSLPSLYEVRDCIEIFPTPDDYYTLRVLGHFGLLPFTADEDQCTIDSHAVFLLALGNAKAHYKQPDAGNYFAQSNSYMGGLVAGAHKTKRYVPRHYERPPMMRPRMVQFDDE